MKILCQIIFSVVASVHILSETSPYKFILKNQHFRGSHVEELRLHFHERKSVRCLFDIIFFTKSPPSLRSEASTESSEPIDLTRLTNSSENMSEKDCASTTKSSEDETPCKKSRFRGKNKIDIEFITKKSRRQSTFSKRKTGLMKKAYELAELTGAEVLLMIASDTNHVYTYGTSKMKPVFESEQGKLLIESCLNGNGSNKNSGQTIKNENEEAYYNQVDNPPPDKPNPIGQPHFSYNSSSCIESDVLLPFSINSGNNSSLSSQNQNPNIIFPNFNTQFATSVSRDGMMRAGGTPQTSLLVPITISSLSSILPKNN